MARRVTVPICRVVRGVTENSLWRKGITITRLKSMAPAKNAPTLYQLLLNPSLKMLCLLLQLKPWNRRARVRVEKAIVLATAELPVSSPM